MVKNRMTTCMVWYHSVYANKRAILPIIASISTVRKASNALILSWQMFRLHGPCGTFSGTLRAHVPCLKCWPDTGYAQRWLHIKRMERLFKYCCSGPKPGWLSHSCWEWGSVFFKKAYQLVNFWVAILILIMEEESNIFSVLCFIISRNIKTHLKQKRKICAVYGEDAVTNWTCQK